MELDIGVRITQAVESLTFISTETESAFLLVAHLPGFEKDEIQVTTNEAGTEIDVSGGGGRVSLEEVAISRRVAIANQLSIGRFRRVFRIPDGVALDRIAAVFDEEAAILLVFLPKLIRREVHGIEIEEIEQGGGGRGEEVRANGDHEEALEPEEVQVSKAPGTETDQNGEPEREFRVREVELELPEKTGEEIGILGAPEELLVESPILPCIEPFDRNGELQPSETEPREREREGERKEKKRVREKEQGKKDIAVEIHEKPPKFPKPTETGLAPLEELEPAQEIPAQEPAIEERKHEEPSHQPKIEKPEHETPVEEAPDRHLEPREPAESPEPARDLRPFGDGVDRGPEAREHEEPSYEPRKIEEPEREESNHEAEIEERESPPPETPDGPLDRDFRPIESTRQPEPDQNSDQTKMEEPEEREPSPSETHDLVPETVKPATIPDRDVAEAPGRVPETPKPTREPEEERDLHRTEEQETAPATRDQAISAGEEEEEKAKAMEPAIISDRDVAETLGRVPETPKPTKEPEEERHLRRAEEEETPRPAMRDQEIQVGGEEQEKAKAMEPPTTPDRDVAETLGTVAETPKPTREPKEERDLRRIEEEETPPPTEDQKILAGEEEEEKAKAMEPATTPYQDVVETLGRVPETPKPTREPEEEGDFHRTEEEEVTPPATQEQEILAGGEEPEQDRGLQPVEEQEEPEKQIDKIEEREAPEEQVYPTEEPKAAEEQAQVYPTEELKAAEEQSPPKSPQEEGEAPQEEPTPESLEEEQETPREQSQLEFSEEEQEELEGLTPLGSSEEQEESEELSPLAYSEEEQEVSTPPVSSEEERESPEEVQPEKLSEEEERGMASDEETDLDRGFRDGGGTGEGEEESGEWRGAGGDGPGEQRPRRRWRASSVPLYPAAVLASSAFLLSLVVLVFHFLSKRRRERWSPRL